MELLETILKKFDEIISNPDILESILKECLEEIIAEVEDIHE